MTYNQSSCQKEQTSQQKRHQWARQLLREHEYISFQYKLKLTSITIEVSQNKSYFGRWSPHERKIEISQDLIQNYPWDIVVQIFKHEVAHQICSEIYNIEEGHGEYFQKACHHLGLQPPFNQATIDLGAPIPLWQDEQNNSDCNSSHFRKIEKLLSLAQSSNEHEAYQAMAKVQQLILKYNIEDISQNPHRQNDYVYLIINHKKKRVEYHQSLIIGLLTEHYFTQAIFSDQYDAETHRTYKTIELMGKKQNVLMAEYVYHFLLQQLFDLWKKNKHQFKNKRSYYIGVLKGVQSTLEQVTRKNPSFTNPQTQTLIQAEHIQIKNYLSQRYPRIHNRTTNRQTRFDLQAYTQGQKDGKDIRINKSLQQQNKTPSTHRLSWTRLLKI